MSVYYHAGNWDAFSGPGADGKMVCGIGSTNPADSHSFSLRFTIGGDDTVMFAGQEAELEHSGGHPAAGRDADRA